MMPQRSNGWPVQISMNLAQKTAIGRYFQGFGDRFAAPKGSYVYSCNKVSTKNVRE